MNITTVTITGADDSIEVKPLLDLQKEYSFVEWAILLSKKQMGNKRFPSLNWLQELKEYQYNLKLSGHLCGKWVREFLLGNNLMKEKYPEIWDIFSRIQLNFHAEFIPYVQKFINNIVSDKEKEYIIQMDNVNNIILFELLYYGASAVPLFDTSHGAGILPDKWPKVPTGVSKCGYAGGLGPDNLKEQIEKILEISSGEIWIDMETKVRSNNDAQFDLEKVEKCLKIAQPYIDKSLKNQIKESQHLDAETIIKFGNN